MKYEVNEKKHYTVLDLKKVSDYKTSFDHVETTFDFERYLLKLTINYFDVNDEMKEFIIELPLDLKTSMTENLTANLKQVEVKEIDEGIDVTYILDIEVSEIDSIEDEVCTLEAPTEDIRIESDEKENLTIKEAKESKDLGFISSLKTEYTKYKIINLAEENLDKIGAKYNLSIEYLYEKKRSNSKVIVHDNE